VSVTNGQPGSQTTFNDAFLSRTTDSDTVAKVGLKNISDPNSGAVINNAQRLINEVADSDGTVGEGDSTRKDYSSNNYVANGDSRKIAIGKLDTALSDVDAETVAIRTLTGTAAGETDLGTFTGSTISDDVDIKVALQELETEVELKIDLSEKGANNGVAELDAGGKVPVSQLPSSLMEYLGTWDANTNTPTLADGVGDNGDVYITSVAGTQNLGSGSITFAVGDWVIYNGTIWQKSINSNAVVSVNGQQGVVSLDTDDIPEGTNEYYTTAKVEAVIAASSIDELSDVDTTTTPPVVGQALVWDGTDWIPGESGSGSGVGGINYIENFDAEVDTADWATYQDAAAAEPVDGTGGTPAVTFTRTTTVSEILRGEASFKFSKGASNRQGEGVSTDFVIDRADYESARPLFVRFCYNTLGAFATGDIRVFVYDKDASTLINVVNGDSGEIVASTTPGEFLGTFSPVNSTSNDFRLIFHVASTNASSYDLLLDQITVGPDAISPSVITSEWTAYTPAFVQGIGTPSSYECFFRRNGDSLDLQCKIVIGTISANEMRVALPAGIVAAGTDKIPSIKNVGLTATSQFNQVQSVLIEPGANYVTFGAMQWVAMPSISPLTKVNGDQVLASSDTLAFFATSIPIAGWTSGATLSSTELVFSSVQVSANKASFSFSNAAFDIITGWNEIVDPFGAFDASTGVFTAPKTGRYFIQASIGFDASAAGTLRQSAIYVNGGLQAISFREPASSSVSVPVELLFSLNRGDTVDIRGYQDSGGALSSSSTGNATRVSISLEPDFSIFSHFGGPLVPHVTTLTSGSGTFTVDRRTAYMKVIMSGGGGAGGSGGVVSTAGTAPTAGGNTTFGSFVAGGGSIGNHGAPGGTGGTNTFSGEGVSRPGGIGQGFNYYSGGALDIGGGGGTGGSNALGGAGGGGSPSASGSAGVANTGAGGGGGGAGSSGASQMYAGSGGGSGGYIEAVIRSPASTYSYAIGAGGSPDTAGTAGGSGGAGGSGVIIIEEYY
jgi:hypothetical protein